MEQFYRLLARLNQAVARYDVGRGGGAPVLTPQDVAAALGMIPAGIGREILIAAAWPDGARLTPGKLSDAIAIKVRAEMDRRHRALQIARLDLHIAQENAAARRAITDEDRREIERLQHKVEQAKAQVWRYDAQMHVRIREAAVDEFSRPNHCETCAGRGALIVNDLKVDCPVCKKQCVVPVSDTKRAGALDVSRTDYRRAWAGLYEYVFGLIRDEAVGASRAFNSALGWP